MVERIDERARGAAGCTVGVFGHYGNRNLGDESITEAVVRALPRHVPGVRLVAFSMDPADSAERYGIPALPVRRTARSGPSRPGSNPHVVREVPMPAARPRADSPPPARGLRALLKRLPLLQPTVRAVRGLPHRLGELVSELRFLRDARRRVSDLDLLLVTGSNQFLDNFGGPWAYPYTLLKWTLLARLSRVPVAFVSVGAGPLDHWLSRAMVRAAVRRGIHVSYRDEASRQLVETGRLRGRGRVFPDLAHALPESLVHARPPRTADSKRLVVGINPMPVYEPHYWPQASEHYYRRYVEALAAFSRKLREQGHRVILYGTQPSDERVIDDILTELELATRTDAAAAGIEVRENRELAELIDVIHETDMVVATRFHGTLLALACRRPVVAICYYRKTRDLMREMGLEEHAVDFEAVAAEDLFTRLQRLRESRVAALERVDRVDAHYRTMLAEQFECIAALLPRAERDAAGVTERRLGRES